MIQNPIENLITCLFFYGFIVAGKRSVLWIKRLRALSYFDIVWPEDHIFWTESSSFSHSLSFYNFDEVALMCCPMTKIDLEDIATSIFDVKNILLTTFNFFSWVERVKSCKLIFFWFWLMFSSPDLLKMDVKHDIDTRRTKGCNNPSDYSKMALQGGHKSKCFVSRMTWLWF